jgi:hypothetical protein
MIDGRMFNQPTVATTLADKGSSSVDLEELKLSNVISVAGIGDPDIGVDHIHRSSNCASLPSTVRRWRLLDS